eukprot:5008874-Amphidinium_carterae.1
MKLDEKRSKSGPQPLQSRCTTDAIYFIQVWLHCHLLAFQSIYSEQGQSYLVSLRSDCDGKAPNGERLFRCPAGFGIFLPSEDVEKGAPEEQDSFPA